MSARSVRFRPCLKWFLALGLLGASAVQAALNAEVNPNPVYVGDPLLLVLSSDSGGDQPDLTPLQKDFEVLRTSTSSQFSMINGRTSSMTRWQVRLRARRSGDLIIPALQSGSERSRPITLKVTDTLPPAAAAAAARDAEHVFVEAGVEPSVASSAQSPYVQQQVPYTVRLYFDDALRDGTLSEPQIADAVIEPVGDERRSTVTRGGRQYQVIERRYAIFPQKSGELQIPPLRFEGHMANPDGGRAGRQPGSSLMQRFLQNSPLANDPFFRGGGLQQDPFGVFADPGRDVRVLSPAVKLTVRPRPAGQSVWLPAADVRLHDSWADAPPQLRAGEPVSRTITIEADGLSGAQIPALELPESAALRLYREPPQQTTHSDGRRLVGISRQTLTYIPAASGALTIPGVVQEWWDTSKDAAAQTRLPEWQLNVAQGAAASAASPQAPAQAPPRAPSSAAIPGNAAPAVAQLPMDEGPTAYWPWAVALMALLGAVVVWLLRRRGFAAGGATVTASAGRSPVPRQSKPPAAADRSTALRELAAACGAQDGPAASRALLALAVIQWPDNPPRNLADLAARLAVGAEPVLALHRHLYGAGGEPWDADALRLAVGNGLQAQPAPTASAGEDLPPLYPHQA